MDTKQNEKPWPLDKRMSAATPTGQVLVYAVNKNDIDFLGRLKEQLGNVKPKGGFRKISDGGEWNKNTCRHPEHKPPMHISLPAGTYEYTCPGCGNVVIINVPLITM